MPVKSRRCGVNAAATPAASACLSGLPARIRPSLATAATERALRSDDIGVNPFLFRNAEHARH